MKLKEGMFVRTLDGILKVVEVRDNSVVSRFVNEDGNENVKIEFNELLKIIQKAKGDSK